MDYKAHLFASLGNGKLHSQRTQCGRHLFRNTKGTFVVKTSTFKSLHEESVNHVCSKCLEWAKSQGKI